MKRLPLVILIACSLLFLGRNLIVRMALTGGVRVVTGLNLRVGGISIGVFRSAVALKEVRLSNPAGFPDPVMMEMPELFVDYNSAGFLRGKIHLEEVRVDIREFLVERDAKGRLNLDSLTVVKEQKERGRQGKVKQGRSNLQVDILRLKVGKVVYKDFSKGSPPRVQEFNVRVNEEFRNVTDAPALTALILTKALFKTTISSLTGFDLGPLEDLASSAFGMAGSVAHGALETTKGVAGKAVDTFKKVLPIGE